VLRQDFFQQLSWDLFKRDLYKSEVLKATKSPKFVANSRGREPVVSSSFQNDERWMPKKKLQKSQSMNSWPKSFLPVLVKK
jgi:hypothetical protein